MIPRGPFEQSVAVGERLQEELALLRNEIGEEMARLCYVPGGTWIAVYCCCAGVAVKSPSAPSSGTSTVPVILAGVADESIVP